MRWIVIGLAIFAASCSKGPNAEKQYNMAAKTGDSAQKCAAAQHVAEAYLADRNEAEFQKWTAQKAGDCASSALYNR